MSVWGVTRVKDEADVIEGVLRHTAREVDRIIVSDNGSTDGTREIIAGLQDELGLVVIDDPEVAYYQSRKMTELGELAAENGATWVVPFDADELWYHPRMTVREALEAARVDVVLVDMLNHYPTAHDLDHPNPFQAIEWRMLEPNPMPKVAVRWTPGAVIEQGNHSVTMPTVEDRPIVSLHIGVMIRHFSYRSVERFLTKVRNGSAAYAAAVGLRPDYGAHWREYGAILDNDGPEAAASIFTEHFFYPDPAGAGLVRDPAPYRRWG